MIRQHQAWRQTLVLALAFTCYGILGGFFALVSSLEARAEGTRFCAHTSLGSVILLWQEYGKGKEEQIQGSVDLG